MMVRVLAAMPSVTVYVHFSKKWGVADSETRTQVETLPKRDHGRSPTDLLCESAPTARIEFAGRDQVRAPVT